MSRWKTVLVISAGTTIILMVDRAASELIWRGVSIHAKFMWNVLMDAIFFGGRVNLNHLVQMVGTLLSLLLLFAVSIKIWFSMLEKLLLDELGELLSPPQNRIGGFIT